ncbi:pentatricopeptide repeat-containing protein, partial [Clarias magur]
KHVTSGDQESQQRKCRRMFRTLHQHHIISQRILGFRIGVRGVGLLDSRTFGSTGGA